MTTQISFLKSKERDRFLDFLAKAEGRDKFGKTIQFIARCLSGIARDQLGYKELGTQLENFWRAMLDARRLHWFGKSFAELRTVESTLETVSLPVEVRYAHATARFFFALRWAIENVFILIKLKVVNSSVPWMTFNKWAKRCWTVSIVAGLATECLKLRRIANDTDLSAEKKKTQRNKCLQTLVCHLGDTGVPAVIAWDFKWSDARVGFLHTIAALIQSSNLYPA